MRACLRIASAATIALATAWPQLAECGAYSYGAPTKALQENQPQTFGTQAQTDRMNRKRDALLALRAEGLKLRDADGGTLTAEHRVYLQTKLDAINADKY
jgi:hypothetical protein